jgi:peptidyl-prolyl cis-trans isomerase B (cyclophilin B)
LKRFTLLAIFLSFSMLVMAGTPNPKVLIKTNYGDIVLKLSPSAAPESVKNFLTYVKDGYYAGTIFHRVIKGFMIQGGGMTPDLNRKTPRNPIKNEADNGLGNFRGTVALARTGDPHSATSQFFINTKDNAFLNHRSKSPNGWGYCVFGKVIKGMDVVNTIENVQTTSFGGRRDVPADPVIIEQMTILKD